ncbi:phage lytic cycle repressor MrpR family protein [Paenibacillus illinoisensis]|uniref:Putative integrase n=1 Tax=Paenibacillus illinoisensis TaxID=59845 RepID=A0A2W0C775_9BACL|nr:hypothetical protein [Paenibacillus illinoisensis]PYY28286.1 putative integrase [Paenibacillus illinoisensis]
MNKIYDDNFYNKDQKMRYLKDQLPSTQVAYARVLKRATIIEEPINKDLYDFNLDQIKQLLKLLRSRKLSTVVHYASIIQNYIRWAIEEDLRQDNINPLDAVPENEWYRQFVDNSIKTLYTEDEILNIIAGTVNFQDKVIIRGLYEGIYGRGYTELLNLKLKDINPDTLEVKLKEETSDGVRYRDFVVTPLFYRLCVRADAETEYLKNNGITAEYTRIETHDLIESDYVVKTVNNSRSNALNNERSETSLVSRKLKKIAKWHGQDGLTPTNIRNSGMLNMAYNIYMGNGKKDLKQEDYYAICDKYNLFRTKDGKFTYSRLKSDFLNIENIKTVYELEE